VVPANAVVGVWPNVGSEFFNRGGGDETCKLENLGGSRKEREKNPGISRDAQKVRQMAKRTGEVVLADNRADHCTPRGEPVNLSGTRMAKTHLNTRNRHPYLSNV